jgi:hypothetical protein
LQASSTDTKKRSATVVAEFVEWVDSSSEGGSWVSPDELDGSVVSCFSVGYVARDDDETLTLAQSFHSEDEKVLQWGHVLLIPKCAIVNRFRVPVV